MPNHVTNRITLSGDKDRIRAMLKVIKNDEVGIGTVDFNKIIPMPESLNIEAGSSTDRGLKAYWDFIEVYTFGKPAKQALESLKNIPVESEQAFLRQRKDIRRDEWELGKKAWQNIQNYGSPSWYEWAYANWGTKWNAYGYDENEDYSNNDELSFQTAWSAPHPILTKLSEMFPDIEFTHKWADEDIGANCGERTYLAGEVIGEDIPDYGKRSYEFAAEVLDCDLLDYGLVINATDTDYVWCDGDELQVVELFGKPALFSNERKTASDIPAGLYCYDLRNSDDGDHFAAIEPHVTVNHGGTVITDWSLDFEGKDHIPLTEETEPNFTGEELTLGQYLRNEYEETETMGGQTL